MLKHKYKILVKGSNSHIPRPIGQKRWGHDASSCCKNFQVLGNFKWMPRWKRIIGTEGRESQGKQVAVILGRTIAAKLPRNVHHVPPIEPCSSFICVRRVADDLDMSRPHDPHLTKIRNILRKIPAQFEQGTGGELYCLLSGKVMV